MSGQNVPAICLEDVTVDYGALRALTVSSLEISSGKTTAVIGPNGSGKTTMFKAILGFVRAKGTVKINGQSPRAVLGELSYVPQRAAVSWDFPVTVEDLVYQGRYRHMGLLRRPSKADRQAVADAMASLEIADLATRAIGELSGGQQQRAFLARALATQASIFLLDEPFQGVDAATEELIASTFSRLNGQGKTVVVVHHDLSTVPDYFQEVILLRQELIAAGAVGEVFTPENLERAYGGKLARFGGEIVVAR